ncbi:unnamed protein product [Ceutorhynchus assimilis]|uniref:MADF domain-containing protein n=1 Tax=Ceutorhynchus assimilis TaxID=467358 RepID=A0A9N9QQP1_9CUCU|nr:unnamed protein product [Ceutorhynchus assimilis]
MKMSKDGNFEIKLIQTVEQYPCLYNFLLPEYSRREVVGAAWEKVSNEMNATVENCRNTWRMLRISYTRATKLPPNGSARKLTQKTKDIIQAMDYIRGYVDAKRHELPNNSAPLPFPDTQDGISNESTEFVDNAYNDIDETVLQASVVQPSVKKFKKTQNSGRDTADNITTLLQYIKSRKQREPENPRRQFLLSLLPDLEQMNERQMRFFRSKVSGLIDDILDSEYGPTSSQPPSVAN